MADEDKDPDPIEFDAELRRYRRREPFIPFDIILTSGDRVAVRDPESLAFTSNTVIYGDSKLGILIYRKNQVVGFHVLEPAK